MMPRTSSHREEVPPIILMERFLDLFFLSAVDHSWRLRRRWRCAVCTCSETECVLSWRVNVARKQETYFISFKRRSWEEGVWSVRVLHVKSSPAIQFTYEDESDEYSKTDATHDKTSARIMFVVYLLFIFLFILVKHFRGVMISFPRSWHSVQIIIKRRRSWLNFTFIPPWESVNK